MATDFLTSVILFTLRLKSAEGVHSMIRTIGYIDMYNEYIVCFIFVKETKEQSHFTELTFSGEYLVS